MWAPRRHNVVADYLCNVAMDNGSSWSRFEDVVLPGQYNLLMHSDGGSRSTCFAVAWVVEAVFMDEQTGTWKQTLVAMSAAFLETPISSFTAEAFALYQCTTFVKSFVGKLQLYSNLT